MRVMGEGFRVLVTVMGGGTSALVLLFLFVFLMYRVPGGLIRR